ncbi:MAG: AsmA family protein, partial [Candidatus Latescibacterota bacterium]
MGRRIVIASVAFLAVIAVLAIAARVVFPPEKVRRLVTEQAGRAIGLPVSVERARVSLFPLRLEVEGLRVDNRTPDAPPLAALREANASMKILPLLSRRIEVSRVRARGLDATLVIERPAEAPGAGGAAGAEGRTDGGSPFALLLSSAEVEEASLRVIDPA